MIIVLLHDITSAAISTCILVPILKKGMKFWKPLLLSFKWILLRFLMINWQRKHWHFMVFLLEILKTLILNIIFVKIFLSQELMKCSKVKFCKNHYIRAISFSFSYMGLYELMAAACYSIIQKYQSIKTIPDTFEHFKGNGNGNSARTQQYLCLPRRGGTRKPLKLDSISYISEY